MTKQEFLNGLQRELAGRMSSGEIAAQAGYYCEYIEVETRKCQNEEAVVEMLGSPSLIARSILEARNRDPDEGRIVRHPAGKLGKLLCSGFARLKKYIWNE